MSYKKPPIKTCPIKKGDVSKKDACLNQDNAIIYIVIYNVFDKYVNKHFY